MSVKQQGIKQTKVVLVGEIPDDVAVGLATNWCGKERPMIRKLKGGKYRLYSRKVNPKTGRRRNLGTFNSRKAAEQHERDIQYFKRH